MMINKLIWMTMLMIMILMAKNLSKVLNAKVVNKTLHLSVIMIKRICGIHKKIIRSKAIMFLMIIWINLFLKIIKMKALNKVANNSQNPTAVKN